MVLNWIKMAIYDILIVIMRDVLFHFCDGFESESKFMENINVTNFLQSHVMLQSKTSFSATQTRNTKNNNFLFIFQNFDFNFPLLNH